MRSPDFVIIISATVSTTLFAFWRPSAFSSSQLDLPPHFSTPLLWLLCFFLRLMGSNCRSDSEIGVQIENRKTGSKKKKNTKQVQNRIYVNEILGEATTLYAVYGLIMDRKIGKNSSNSTRTAAVYWFAQLGQKNLNKKRVNNFQKTCSPLKRNWKTFSGGKRR